MECVQNFDGKTSWKETEELVSYLVGQSVSHLIYVEEGIQLHSALWEIHGKLQPDIADETRHVYTFCNYRWEFSTLKLSSR
jgi:hypothetical protein